MTLFHRLAIAKSYIVYLWRHKLGVYRAGRRMGLGRWRLLVHDWSKLRPSEFWPYARFFYGLRPGATVCLHNGRVYKVVGKEGMMWRVRRDFEHLDGFETFLLDEKEIDRQAEQAAFDRAWRLHQIRNPHHWQHWLLVQDDPGGTMREVYQQSTILAPGGVPLAPVVDAFRVLDERSALPMDLLDATEMVADWASFEVNGRGKVADWYRRKREEIVLHPETRALVERLLETYWGYTVPSRP